MNLMAFRSQATVFRGLPRRQAGVPRHLAEPKGSVTTTPSGGKKSGNENPVSTSVLETT